MLTKNGGRVAWSASLDLIAFDRVGNDGFYDIYSMQPDGSDQQCLTCEVSEFASRHVGNPDWHPSGQWLVVQVEKVQHRGGSRRATPGRGLENDLWIITSDGQQQFPLNEVTAASGVLHPHFSSDGTRLSWTEYAGAGGPLGNWVLKVADFSFTADRPQLSNIKTYAPFGETFYENHGFSPDGSRLLFTASPPSAARNYVLEIYTLDLATQETTALTRDGSEWNEHAHYSPSGYQIVWASSRGTGWNGRVGQLTLEWWIMDADGANARQLSHFNDPDYPEYQDGESIAAADIAWGPNGRALVGYTIINQGALANLLEEQGSPIQLITFPTE